MSFLNQGHISHWIYCHSLCIFIILLGERMCSGHLKIQTRCGHWHFDHLGFLLPNVLLLLMIVGEEMGKLLAPILLQLQKDPPHINSPQTPHSCAGFIGPFSPDLILAIQNGVICCRFYDPSPTPCFAINSRYEGRANKTAIVRAIRAITPDKPLPKCSSASSKSNQIIKQQI